MVASTSIRTAAVGNGRASFLEFSKIQDAASIDVISANCCGQKRKSMKKIRIIVASFVFISSATIGAQPTDFNLADSSATFHVVVSWVDENGAHSTSGTGIRVAPKGTILTAAHLFPESSSILSENGKKRIEVVVNISGPGVPIVQKHLRCEVIRAARIAFCDNPDLRSNNVVSVDWGSAPFEQQQVWIRGYSKGGPLKGARGFVTLPGKPITATDALLAIGYSGGPVYYSKKVIGLVEDGEKVAEINDVTTMGLGRFVVLSDVKKFIPEARMKSITNPFADDAIKAYEKDMEGKAPFMPIGIPNRYFGTDKDGRLLEYESIGDANPPNTLSLSYTVNVTASAHNGFSKTRTPYRMTFKPQPGFKIVGYQVEKLSVNGLVNEKGVIHANGSSLDYSFELESGPVYDRFRGWMKATVSVQQEFAK